MTNIIINDVIRNGQLKKQKNSFKIKINFPRAFTFITIYLANSFGLPWDSTLYNKTQGNIL